MILSKLPCPDCDGTGRHKRRIGLCDRCHGEGKRQPTAQEEAVQVQRSITPMCGCGQVPAAQCACGIFIYPPDAGAFC